MYNYFVVLYYQNFIFIIYQNFHSQLYILNLPQKKKKKKKTVYIEERERENPLKVYLHRTVTRMCYCNHYPTNEEQRQAQENETIFCDV